eukprot:4641819-Pyramimonas_sp.AAC.1
MVASLDPKRWVIARGRWRLQSASCVVQAMPCDLCGVSCGGGRCAVEAMSCNMCGVRWRWELFGG